GGIFTSTPAGLALDSLTGAIVPVSSTPGTYTVTYTLDSTATCPIFTISTTVTIHATSAVAQNLSICQGDSILLGGVFQTTAGVYLDTLTNSNNCDSVVSTTLSINPIVTTQINDSICQGDSILLGGIFQTIAGTYYDTLQSSLSCDSIIETILAINALPVITTSNDTNVCPGINVNITAFGANTYSWDNSLGAGQNHNVAPITTTTYIVTGTDTNGCSDTGSVLITITPGTIADAGSDITLCEGDPVNLNGNTPTVAGETGLWTTSSLGVITNPANPMTPVTGLTIGVHTFTWTITNAACPPSSDSVNVTIESCEPSALIIPNVFTPNGDGQNDVFTVDGTNLISVNCEVYNRWGQLMYSWDNVKGAWDGRTLSGSEVPDGTYFYIIQAEGDDGTEYFQKGGFSLIR
ncbi:MAG: gliding motility-associated C-terminal domain-containing protein, partial [Vicingaceae bacterium]|nr:gliding motility-associated C-terminal domain-containing protein [Vicingaceae bacterium]